MLLRVPWIGRDRHLGPDGQVLVRIKFFYAGGWLTHGDVGFLGSQSIGWFWLGCARVLDCVSAAFIRCCLLHLKLGRL